MKFSFFIALSLFCNILVGCSPWRSWGPERPNNTLYKESGFGINNRHYSRENMKVLDSYLINDTIEMKPINRKKLYTLDNSLEYSKRVVAHRDRNFVLNYLNGYKKVFNSKKYLTDASDPSASKKKYFDLNSYYRRAPSDNVDIINNLFGLDIIPMDDFTAQEIERIAGEDLTKKRSQPINDSVFASKKIDYYGENDLAGYRVSYIKNSDDEISDKKLKNKESLKESSLHTYFLDSIYLN